MEKVLGLDLGVKTLGIAQSDCLGFVHGVETFFFPRNKYEVAVNHVIELLNKLGITSIALGYPLHLSGEKSPMADLCLSFRNALLKINPALKITLVDERYSTVTAHQAINARGYSHEKRKENVDKIAACVILDTYIRREQFKDGKDE